MKEIKVELEDDEYDAFRQISESILRTPENHIEYWIRTVVEQFSTEMVDEQEGDEGVSTERV